MVLSGALHYRIKDATMKAIYVQNDQLLAGTVQGGIEDGSQCLSVGMDQQPILHIEHKNIMDLYCSKEESKNFTFYMWNMWDSGLTYRLESALYPGWFLCTLHQQNQPVTLTNHPDDLGSVITDFYLNLCG
ncbi:interleukin-1 family member 10 isoform X5 [Petaurus breviceps papuanus]|uniref:interleukin-1 family member 10 isoform X5 n=1 Tax=Petaurus breviceps papuanus TaxID=3040969 RepID=UPI0036D9620B